MRNLGSFDCTLLGCAMEVKVMKQICLLIVARTKVPVTQPSFFHLLNPNNSSNIYGSPNLNSHVWINEGGFGWSIALSDDGTTLGARSAWYSRWEAVTEETGHFPWTVNRKTMGSDFPFRCHPTDVVCERSGYSVINASAYVRVCIFRSTGVSQNHLGKGIINGHSPIDWLGSSVLSRDGSIVAIGESIQGEMRRGDSLGHVAISISPSSENEGR